MRESSRIEKTHLPIDVFEEWIKSQVVRPAETGRSVKSSENHYETWVRRRVEKRMRRKQ